MNKDQKFMELARTIGKTFSKDRSSQIGCVIVGEGDEILSSGYNGMARKVNDDIEERHERPLKYSWFVHGERNAIYNAARTGVKLLGSRLYVTTLCPCVDCVQGIIQSGIKTVFIEEWALSLDNPRAAAWNDSWIIGKEMLDEVGIPVIVI